jgi:undecaprenyl-diphosphatase
MPAILQRDRTHSHRRKLIAALGTVVFALAVWIFVELADDAVPGRYLGMETRILRAFRHSDDVSRGLGPPAVTQVVRDITALGSATVLTLLVTLVLGFLLLRRSFRAAGLILVATSSGMLFSASAKSLTARERPQVVPHLAESTAKSFPSGHSMMSSVVYLTLGALLAQNTARRREKIYIVAAAFFLTTLVGLSRVYLGVHYPTDVLAGWAAGVAWSLLCWAIAWWLQHHGKLQRPTGPGVTQDKTPV